MVKYFLKNRVSLRSKTIILVISVLVILAFSAVPAKAATGSLKIIVNTTGGDGTFRYVISGNFAMASSATITTVEGINSKIIPINFGPSSYDNTTTLSIAQTLPTGWKLDSVSCNKPSRLETNGVTKVTLNAHYGLPAPINCTFNNIKNIPLGYLQIVKKTKGGDGIFNYNIFPTPSIVSFPTVSGTGSSKKIWVTPGTYTITEKVPIDWKLDSVSCDQPSTDVTDGVKDVNILDKQTVSCTFSNTKKGILQIITNTIGGNETFNYHVSFTPSVVNVETINGTGSSYPIVLDPGTHTIIQVVPDEWTLSYVYCNQPDTDVTDDVTVAIESGQTTTCIFDNFKTSPLPPPPPPAPPPPPPPSPPLFSSEWPFLPLPPPSISPLPPGNLVIIRNNTLELEGGNRDGTFIYSVTKLSPNGDGTYSIDYNLAQEGSRSITTVNGIGSLGLTKDPAYRYQISEASSITWGISSVSCERGGVKLPSSSFSFSSAPRLAIANVNVVAGQTTICTFFTFPSTDYLQIYTVTKGQDATFSYSVVDKNPRKYMGNPDIDILPIQNITTVGGFGLTELLKLPKGSFVFCGSASCTYDYGDAAFVVKETVPSSTLDHFYCRKGGVAYNTSGYISPSTGDTITTCVFYYNTNANNTPPLPPQPLTQGYLTINEVVVSNFFDAFNGLDNLKDGFVTPKETFNYNIDPTPSMVSITTHEITSAENYLNPYLPSGGYNVGSNTIMLDPGTNYSVIGKVPDGWTFDHASCDDQTSIKTTNGLTHITVLSASYAKATNCYFYHRKDNTYPQTGLKIIQSTTGGDEKFNYTIAGTNLYYNYNTSIITNSSTGSSELMAVDPGIYAIAQTPPIGWTFNSVVCDDETSTDVKNGVMDVTVVTGKTITCTFSNTKNTNIISPTPTVKVEVKKPEPEPEPEPTRPRPTNLRPY